MKKHTYYQSSALIIAALFFFPEISASQNPFSMRSLLVTTTVGFFTLGQAAPKAWVKIKPYASFDTGAELAQDFYVVPSAFAAVCCPKKALQKNHHCSKEAARISDKIDPNLVATCCLKSSLEERSNCFFNAVQKI